MKVLEYYLLSYLVLNCFILNMQVLSYYMLDYYILHYYFLNQFCYNFLCCLYFYVLVQVTTTLPKAFIAPNLIFTTFPIRISSPFMIISITLTVITLAISSYYIFHYLLLFFKLLHQAVFIIDSSLHFLFNDLLSI